MRAAMLRSVPLPWRRPSSAAIQSPPVAASAERAPAVAYSPVGPETSKFLDPHEPHVARNENRNGRCCAGPVAPGAGPEHWLNSGEDPAALHPHQTPAPAAP